MEITEIADLEMKKPGGGLALLFEKPLVNGQCSPFPLAINTLGSWKRMALSLGAGSVDEVAAELGSLMKAKPPTGFREALKLRSARLSNCATLSPSWSTTVPARKSCTASKNHQLGPTFGRPHLRSRSTRRQPPGRFHQNQLSSIFPFRNAGRWTADDS